MFFGQLRRMVGDRHNLGFTMSAKPKLKLTEYAPSEHDEQSIVIAWADELAQWKRFPELELLYAIPNGGYASPGDL